MNHDLKEIQKKINKIKLHFGGEVENMWMNGLDFGVNFDNGIQLGFSDDGYSLYQCDDIGFTTYFENNASWYNIASELEKLSPACGLDEHENRQECPNCQSQNIDWGNIEDDDGNVCRTNTCLDCDKVWQELYEFDCIDFEPFE